MWAPSTPNSAAFARSQRTSPIQVVQPRRELRLSAQPVVLLCLVQRAQIQARDDLAEMFSKRIARFHAQAPQELELIRARHRAPTDDLIDTLADVLRVMESNPPDAEVGRQVKSAVADHGDIGELLAGCDAIAAYSGDNHLPLLWRFYRSHRPVLYRMARTLH
jgi:hypothetical protein